MLWLLDTGSYTITEDWIYKHRDQIEVLSTPLAAISTRAVIHACNTSKEVVLITKHHYWLDLSKLILQNVKKYDKELCKKLITDNLPDIEYSIKDLQPIHWEGYYKFFAVLIKIAPDIIIDLLLSLDVDELKSGWDKNLSDSQNSYRKAGAVRDFKKFLVLISDLIQDKSWATLANDLILKSDRVLDELS